LMLFPCLVFFGFVSCLSLCVDPLLFFIDVFSYVSKLDLGIFEPYAPCAKKGEEDHKHPIKKGSLPPFSLFLLYS